MINLFKCYRRRYFGYFRHSSINQFPNILKANNSLEQRDAIGPPNPVSNLRPVIFAQNKNETNLEKQYREARENTQAWNQHFWTVHNYSFVEERKEFQRVLKNTNGKDSVTADEMSVFYKRFLDKNWAAHCKYNVSWYKQNIKILILELRVRLSKIKLK